MPAFYQIAPLAAGMIVSSLFDYQLSRELSNGLLRKYGPSEKE
jgi:hypothetical protein